MIVIFNLI